MSQSNSFWLMSKWTGMCLHTSGESPKSNYQDGGGITFWSGCLGYKSLFRFVDTGDGDESFMIQNVETGRCLHTNQWRYKGARQHTWHRGQGCTPAF